MSDSGWQPAVDNLQSQINSINSEISILSGQETTQATQLSLLSGQLSALQTEVSAIQQQVAQGNLLADLSGASVSNAFNAPALLSLKGNSVLSTPPARQAGISVSSQSALQFMFSAQWNNTSNPASVTLTQFKLSLI